MGPDISPKLKISKISCSIHSKWIIKVCKCFPTGFATLCNPYLIFLSFRNVAPPCWGMSSPTQAQFLETELMGAFLQTPVPDDILDVPFSRYAQKTYNLGTHKNLTLVAAKTARDVLDPWVRWEKGQVGI